MRRPQEGFRAVRGVAGVAGQGSVVVMTLGSPGPKSHHRGERTHANGDIATTFLPTYHQETPGPRRRGRSGRCGQGRAAVTATRSGVQAAAARGAAVAASIESATVSTSSSNTS